MQDAFNYKHLFYFWVVAKEGGISHAAARLGMAVQTISAQVRALERDLGCQLLKPAGRGVVLTEAGRVAFETAEPIFELGAALPQRVRAAANASGVRLVVGIADGLPKLEVQRLLRPVLKAPQLHLVCHEGEIADLMADLVVHRLDVVLADRPAPAHAQLKVHSHALGGSDIGWFATAHWYSQAQADYPRALSRVPLLLPTTHSHVRGALDQWLLRHALTPRVVGEFEDSALLEAFGGNGMGVFPAALAVADDLQRRHGALLLGACDGVREAFYAVTAQRRVEHPLVRLMMAD
jgi:LysR family transcriptional regulator, transcriptional activator of nhaA